MLHYQKQENLFIQKIENYKMPLLIAYMTTYLLSSNDWLILVGKKVHPHGFLYFIWTSVVSLCIRVNFDMHFVWGMAGVSQMCHHLVTVVCHSLLTMQWRAAWAAFRQFAIIKYEISLLPCCLKYDIMLPLNLTYSHWMVTQICQHWWKFTSQYTCQGVLESWSGCSPP